MIPQKNLHNEHRQSTLSHYNFLKLHMLSSLLTFIQFLCYTRQRVMVSMKNSKTEHNMQCEKVNLRERVEKGRDTVMLVRWWSRRLQDSIL